MTPPPSSGGPRAKPDCGDNSCLYAANRGGMRTNGGCQCDECGLCGATIRPGRPGRHRPWCQQPEWIPEHHRPSHPAPIPSGPPPGVDLDALAKLEAAAASAHEARNDPRFDVTGINAEELEVIRAMEVADDRLSRAAVAALPALIKELREARAKAEAWDAVMVAGAAVDGDTVTTWDLAKAVNDAAAAYRSKRGTP